MQRFKTKRYLLLTTAVGSAHKKTPVQNRGFLQAKELQVSFFGRNAWVIFKGLDQHWIPENGLTFQRMMYYLTKVLL